MNERDFIERLEAAFPRLRREDDAALCTIGSAESPGGPDGALALAVDAAVEGVHFTRNYSTLSQAVQKLVTSNISDIYAMGGKPEVMLFTAGLARGCTDAEAEEIVDGLRKAASFYAIDVAGGDTVSSGDRFFFNISIAGSRRHSRFIERSGAEPGDLLVLFGDCGCSLLGMDVLRRMSGMGVPGRLPRSIGVDIPSWDGISRSVEKLEIGMDDAGIEFLAGTRGPVAEQMLALAKRHLVPEAIPVDTDLLSRDPMPLTAMIDISDGLARDTRNLCRASGTGAVIREALLPVPEAFPLFLGEERELWTEYILASGEEYVMLASSAGEPPSGTVIGEIVPENEGLTIIGRDGERRELPDTGFEHSF